MHGMFLTRRIGIVMTAVLAPWLVIPQDEPAPAELLQKGPFQLRALKPSERPWLSQLTEPKRFAALQAARDVSIFAARGERESFGAVVMGQSSVLNGEAGSKAIPAPGEQYKLTTGKSAQP